MATDDDLSQIEVQTVAANKEQTCDEKEEGSHLSTNYVSYSDELRNISLRIQLGKFINRVYTKVRSKFKNYRCFLWPSKAVVLILAWNLMISIGFKSFLDPSLYTGTILSIDFDGIYYKL